MFSVGIWEDKFPVCFSSPTLTLCRILTLTVVTETRIVPMLHACTVRVTQQNAQQNLFVLLNEGHTKLQLVYIYGPMQMTYLKN